MSWPRQKISEFAEVTTGGTPSTSVPEYWENGTIPWLNSGDLNKGVITEASNFITEAGLKSSSTKLMPKNSVLIALTGSTTGVSAISKIEACANQSVTGIHPSNKHYPDYLYYFFRTQREKIFSKTWGGAQPHINQKFIKDYLIPLPPLKAQIQIAHLLKRSDILIQKRKESILHIDSLLYSYFINRFGSPIRNEKKFKIQRLGTLGEWKSGGTPSRTNPVFFEGAYPWITSGELENLFINNSKEKITPEAIEKSNAKLIESGSLLLGMYDTAALKSSITKSVATCNQAIAYSKLDDKVCNTIYVYYLIQIGKDYFKREQRGVRQQNMNLTMIKNINVMLPPLLEQNKFAEIVNKAQDLKVLLSHNIKDLQKLYGYIFNKTIEGNFDLNNITIDVEEEEYFSGTNDRIELEHFSIPSIKSKKRTEKKNKRHEGPFEIAKIEQISEVTNIKELDKNFEKNLNTDNNTETSLWRKKHSSKFGIFPTIEFNEIEGKAILQDVFLKKEKGFTFKELELFLNNEDIRYTHKQLKTFILDILSSDTSISQYFFDEKWQREGKLGNTPRKDDFSGNGKIYFVPNKMIPTK